MANFVNAIEALGMTSASPLAASSSPSYGAPHWSEQSASKEDVARMSQLARATSTQGPDPASATAPAQQTARAAIRLTGPDGASASDALGRKELFAALEKLRNTPAERMPVAAAELMVQCYEYQFNVTAVTQAAKNFEDSVQTMTTRT